MFKNKARGFTLIELLVVIAIIGILSSVVLASLNDARQKSRDAKRVADIKQLQLALELFFDSNGSYATTGLSALAPTYIAVEPTDPVTGASYIYDDLTTGNTSTDYHLGANLESSSHSALDADVDTNSTAISDGADDDSCTGAAGTYCYDVKP